MWSLSICLLLLTVKDSLFLFPLHLESKIPLKLVVECGKSDAMPFPDLAFKKAGSLFSFS